MTPGGAAATAAKTRTAARRRFFVPEVVQTSAMDCGPASLKALLEGFGVGVSYGRLREACQTDVDGTSIDTLEEVAVQLGLQAEQVMLPADHLLRAPAQALPALVVVRLPNGLTHFIVVWKRVGPYVQVMDPGSGRRWTRATRLLGELYIHRMPVPADAWREWAGDEEFGGALRQRIEELGGPAGPVMQKALADESWRGLAALDATTRMVSALVRAGAARRGGEATRLLERFVDRAREEIEAEAAAEPEAAAAAAERQSVPDPFWSVRPSAPDEDGDAQVELRGAVLVRVLGARPLVLGGVGDAGDGDVPAPEDVAAQPEEPAPLSPELVAALEEAPPRPWRQLLGFLRGDGALAPTLLLFALALSAGAMLVEALLFRGLLDISQHLVLPSQRIGAVGVIVTFGVALILLELPVAQATRRLGRRLELRLRVAFLEKIPRLSDRYFQSRLSSDMAERSHTIHAVRQLPELAASLLRASFALALTTLGIAWLDPASLWLALVVAAISVALPLLVQPLMTERDLRLRTHGGALSRFYLDALLGLVAVRAHGAERAVRREHESLLVEWSRAGYSLQRAVVGVDAILALAGTGLAAWLLLAHLSRGGEVGAVLLLVYWSLALPSYGQQVALAARQYPAQRNLVLRLLEPLGAPEARGAEAGAAAAAAAMAAEPGAGGERDTGVALSLEGVSVVAGGHAILREVDLAVSPGEQLAVVGPSGAGKSSLVGLLLGWHRPASGALRVDGAPLEGAALDALRTRTAWVDPAVQLWNRSLLENLRYGLAPHQDVDLGPALDAANLYPVVEQLPGGLQSELGEGGARVSGGEGQRVRFGRALSRPGVRLAILDEPFRGLDRAQRRRLLRRARAAWPGATLLCVTHDIGATADFDRVVVIDNGRLVEDDAPDALLQREGSLYSALSEADTTARETLWRGADWRHLHLADGRLTELDAPPVLAVAAAESSRADGSSDEERP